MIIFISLVAFTGCSHPDYYYEDDYDCSVVPLTNNPDLTNEKSSLLPQMGY